MTKRKNDKGTLAFCKEHGISLSTYFRRKAKGQDLTAPPLIGAARARHALKKSPWVKSSSFREKVNVR